MPTPFDLVILDLDGTIIDLYSPGGVAQEVLETIQLVQAAGVLVTIGTGRTLAYICSHLSHLGVTTPVVSAMGAVIGDPVSGKVLEKNEVSHKSAHWVAQWSTERQLVCGFYFCDEQGRFRIVQNFDGSKSQEFYDHVITTPRQVGVDLATTLVGTEANAPIKFLLVNDLNEGEDIAPHLRSMIGGDTTIVRTHPMLVEGTALGVDKGYGLRHLCKLLGIDIRRVLAIGDADNDIPMLEAAGTAVAMGNATPGVLAVADWVAPNVDQHGAAVAMRRFVLRE